MKHWMQIVTVAALGMFLVACGGDKSGSDGSSAAAEIKIPADWVGIYSIDAADSCNGESVTLNITASNISYTSSYSPCKMSTEKLVKVSAEGDSLTVEHDYAFSTTETFTRVGDQLLVSSSRGVGASGTFKKGLPAEGAGKKVAEAAAPAAAEKPVEMPEGLRGKWKGKENKCDVQITKKKLMFSSCAYSFENGAFNVESIEADEPIYEVKATKGGNPVELTFNLEGESMSIVGGNQGDKYSKVK